MKLQILVPHYKEKAADVLPLLDSIALQQNVPFNEIGVIICHDGEESHDFVITKYPEGADEYTMVREFPFEVKQVRQEHKGVSAARNACLDAATADYVMFADADDMFASVCGFFIIFREMKEGFDSLISMFQEETRTPDRKEIIYINHEMDSTFVHGKVHKRQYLLDKHIRWNENLTIHEDSFFNILCQNLSKQVKYCPFPFYLWRWRDDSVCRHDPKYILKTYNNMLDSNDALIKEFLKRGMMDKAVFYTVFMIFDAYYTMNKPEWINQENQEYRDKTELRFSDYYVHHEDLWNSMPVQEKMQVSVGVRNRSVNEGMEMEAITINSWLEHIKELRK